MRWNERARTRDTLTKIHLEGLTEGGVSELASLARSWESPASLTLAGAGFSGGDYDPGERAWIVTSTSPSAWEPLTLTLAASPDSPLENVAVVVKGWGDGDASLVVDGREVSRGPRFRIGHRQRLEATDLIVFLAIRATAPVRLVLTPR